MTADLPIIVEDVYNTSFEKVWSAISELHQMKKWFFEQMESMDGVRLPGQRRHNNRKDTGPRNINTALVEKIKSLLE